MPCPLYLQSALDEILVLGKKEPYSRKARDSGRWHSFPVYSRDSLPSGFSIKGPAMIDEPGTSTLIPAGWSSKVGTHGEIRMVLNR